MMIVGIRKMVSLSLENVNETVFPVFPVNRKDGEKNSLSLNAYEAV